MRVTDNGCGIAREDIKKAFVPHATSKISSQEDLAEIVTLGFRGEALASIAAVARVDLLTKSPEEQFGNRYVIEGGEEKMLDDAGCPNGTTIIVRDLFYNTPARMKFLKKNVSEANAVADVLDRMALSHPEVSLRFIRDGKEALFTPGDGKLLSAVYAVYGREFADSLIPLAYENAGVCAKGYISKPLAARATRSMQLFFVNGRFVKTATAGAALCEAYKNSIMVGKFPACVLHISFPPNAVDVNVHPAKIEVRFSNERLIFDTVYYGVKSALAAGDTRPEMKFSQPKPFTKPDDVFKKTEAFKEQKFVYKPSDSAVFRNPVLRPEKPVCYQRNPDAFIDPQKDAAHPSHRASYEKTESAHDDIPISESIPSIAVSAQSELPEPKLIGEAFGTYVLIEVGQKILLIDKHAAHERILYNHLCEHKNAASAQMLIKPVAVTLRKEQHTLLLDNLSLLEEAGIIAEDFGAGSVIVRSVPMCLDGENITSLIEEVAERLAKNPREVTTEKLDWLYHSIACRAAIKAGDHSDDAELMALARQIIADDSIRYCPHGRPVAIWLSKHELEKQFGRV